MSDKKYGHYTSQTGMMGIIRSENLWATNIKYLNDEHEFQHVIDLIKEIIPTSKYTNDRADYDQYVQYIESLESKISTLDSYKSDSVFTVSFTEETDLLSQWRGYCPGNNGFCIKYDLEKLFGEIKEAYEEAHLLQCVYDQDEKESAIKEVLNNYWNEFINEADKAGKKQVIDELTREILLLASHFKHPSFSEEKEKRIVIILEYAPDHDLKFREGQFSIVPYIELPAPKDFITELVVGPTSNKKLSKRSLESFLEATYGTPSWISGPTVSLSSTPYRSW